MRVLLCQGCVLLLLISSAVSAQNAPLTFDEVLDLAMRHSPVLGSEYASQRVADALVQQAGTSPNPILQFQSQTDGLERLSLIGLAVSQPIELGHKKSARIKAAESNQSVAFWELEVRRLALRQEIRERFLSVLLADAQMALAEEMFQTTLRHLEIARARLEAGDVSGLEVTALEVESDRRRAQKVLTVGVRDRAVAKLSEHLLVDESTLSGGFTGDLGWPYLLPELDSITELTGEVQQLQLARARTQTKLDLVGVERSRGVSDLTVQAGVFVQRDVFPGSSFSPRGVVSGLDDTGPLLQLQLQIPLPLNDTNAGNIAAAKARAEQSEYEFQVLQRKLQADLRGLYHTLTAQREARRLLEYEVLPNSRRALDTVERAYALGFRSQIDLLLAREAYLRSSDDALQSAFAESMTAAELEALLGKPLPTESLKP